MPEVGGDVTVGAFNVLNYFTTMGSRGANNDEAVNTVVDALNERADEDRYSALATDTLGTDEITTAIIYQDDAVKPVGDFEVLDETVDERFDTARHRPALAQTFEPVNSTDAELQEFTVVTNHLKSKGSECGSEGNNTHLVGSCDVERTAAADAMVDWIDESDMPNAVITGDLNAYDQEAPITALKDGGYVDLRQHFDGEEAYSYVFDGQLGYLDYALASDELMPFVTGAASWHANSDEVTIFDYSTEFKQPAQQAIYEPGPYHASDHDPVLLGLSLTEGDNGEEPTAPAEPEEPEAPADAELTIGPDHIAVQNFVGNPNSGKDVGVLLQVDGLEAGQDVTFTVTRESGNGQSGTQTITANDEGIAQWRVTDDDLGKGGQSKGTYAVEATNGNDTLTGSFDVSPHGNGKNNR